MSIGKKKTIIVATVVLACIQTPKRVLLAHTAKLASIVAKLEHHLTSVYNAHNCQRRVGLRPLLFQIASVKQIIIVKRLVSASNAYRATAWQFATRVWTLMRRKSEQTLRAASRVVQNCHSTVQMMQHLSAMVLLKVGCIPCADLLVECATGALTTAQAALKATAKISTVVAATTTAALEALMTD